MEYTKRLQIALELHEKWINCDPSGSKISLVNADLSGADLKGANLRLADLRSADLSGADLSGADLHDADLRWANTINIKGLDVISVMDIKYYPILKKATAGTFSGTLDELKAVIEKQDDPVTVKRYQIAFKAIEDLLETL